MPLASQGRKVTVVRCAMEAEIAGWPYTTACSPNRTILPGALATTSSMPRGGRPRFKPFPFDVVDDGALKGHTRTVQSEVNRLGGRHVRFRSPLGRFLCRLARLGALLALLGTASGFFIYQVQKATRLVLKGAPEDRFDSWGLRFKEVLTGWLGQKKVLADPVAGTMHVLMFWGFLMLSTDMFDLASANRFSDGLLEPLGLKGMERHGRGRLHDGLLWVHCGPDAPCGLYP